MSADETAIPKMGEETTPPRDSATVIVARDGTAGLEIFMLERHVNSDFVGGAYVFPGGKVDEADSDPALHAFIDGADPTAAAGLVEAGERGLGFHVAALRETFEEAGVLLARHADDGSPVRLDGSDAERFAHARKALIAGETTLLGIARDEKIRYALDLMHYFNRWITPHGLHRRYDTRFFVARVPDGQTPLHDAVETTASTWVRPHDALARARAGELTVIFPTRKTLEALAEFADVDDAIASCRDKVIVPLLPRLVVHEGMPKVVLPGDDRFHDP
jgi:8-oxo-dGTP pyrophosphatase MutT (NUDIX family)